MTSSPVLAMVLSSFPVECAAQEGIDLQNSPRGKLGFGRATEAVKPAGVASPRLPVSTRTALPALSPAHRRVMLSILFDLKRLQRRPGILRFPAVPRLHSDRAVQLHPESIMTTAGKQLSGEFSAVIMILSAFAS